ncbi:hypothetical protein MMC13_006605 [Lambiella insularis]|nr:hypothetical protein [Lambiella insularis]
MAYVNVKRLQIGQHRAWMLRTWTYLTSIITLRLIMILIAIISALQPSLANYITMSCAEIVDIFQGVTATAYELYPACDPIHAAFAPDGMVIVKGLLGSKNTAETAASLDMGFGAAAWLALGLHVLGVEMYLRLTPRESERLRQVSYERQLERGMQNPGSAGLVVEKFGDAEPWVSRVDQKSSFSSQRTESTNPELDRQLGL